MARPIFDARNNNTFLKKLHRFKIWNLKTSFISVFLICYGLLDGITSEKKKCPYRLLSRFSAARSLIRIPMMNISYAPALFFCNPSSAANASEAPFRSVFSPVLDSPVTLYYNIIISFSSHTRPARSSFFPLLIPFAVPGVYRIRIPQRYVLMRFPSVKPVISVLLAKFSSIVTPFTTDAVYLDFNIFFSK